MLREYNEMNKEIKNPENAVEYTIYKTMKTYFASCKKKKNTAKKKFWWIWRTRQNKLKLLSNCSVWDKKKSSFIKNQEMSWLMNKLGIRTPLKNFPLICGIYF